MSATISAVGDIPLVPAMTTGSSANSGKNKNFVIHWMNNKEIEFSLQVSATITINLIVALTPAPCHLDHDNDKSPYFAVTQLVELEPNILL